MAWHGATLTAPSSLEIRALLKAMALDVGRVVRCACGAARYCGGLDALKDEIDFDALHVRHRRKEGP